MPDDIMIKPANPQPLPSVGKIFPEIEIEQKAKEPNKFLRILGGIAGGAANIIAPGLGGLVGSLIGGGSSFGSYATLLDRNRQFEEMQKYNEISNSLQQRQQNQMMNQQQTQSMQLLSMQHRVSMQSQEFTTVSNLLKTRHDSEMTAVNNIKS